MVLQMLHMLVVVEVVSAAELVAHVHCNGGGAEYANAIERCWCGDLLFDVDGELQVHALVQLHANCVVAQHVEEEDGRHDASHARRKETREDAGSVSEAN